MKNQEFKDWLQSLINDSRVKSIEITKWEDFGEYSGQIIKPVFKIEKFQMDLINKPVETTNEQPFTNDELAILADSLEETICGHLLDISRDDLELLQSKCKRLIV